MSLAINLADARLGATVLWATDEFFGAKERVLQAGEPQWREGVYDDHGKWMDGWETRRRRDSGHDYCVIRLAALAQLERLEIDTRFFTGNFPPYVSVDACHVEDAKPAPPGTPPEALEGAPWREVLARTALKGNDRAQFDLAAGLPCTHLRLHLFPDGGIARLRAFGRPLPHAATPSSSELMDLAAALNGGVALRCSDEHYGAMNHLLLPGRGTSMADGWETRRRREPGFDWVIVRLGIPGVVRALEIDTAHFKGNFPHQVSVQAGLSTDSAEEPGDPASQSLYWPTLLEPQALSADAVHRFDRQLLALAGTVRYVRMNIHPDGGVSRLRVLGVPAGSGPTR